MTASTPADRYLLLGLSDDVEASPDSGSSAPALCLDVRCLNTSGRWAVKGFPRMPLLVWHPSQADAAHEAARRAAESRNRSITVVTRMDARWLEGQDVRFFSEAFEPALHGCEARSAGRSRRLAVEAEKLGAFSLVVRTAASATSREAYAQVSRAASGAFHARFGGGSIASACEWLAGPAGQEALADLLSGETGLSVPLSFHQVAEAVELARDVENVQRAGRSDR